MVKNMGLADRVIRVLLAIVVGILYVMGAISGTVALVLGIIAVVFVLTSAVSFCPAYLPFKISTCRKP
jgi:Inner membrane protein YgaP-like, transmembrane domain